MGKKVKKGEGSPKEKGERQVIQEGEATMVMPPGVFYNKAQVINRDLSICMIKMFEESYSVERQAKAERKAERKRKAAEQGHNNDGASGSAAEPPARDAAEGTKGISILEALSATGLRSVRYVKEIPNVRLCLANDIVPAAVKAIQENIDNNECDTNVLKANLGDANMVMYKAASERKFFDVVDLDPYGSAATFLNAAVQSIADGGLLCVTCTDMAVLSGNHVEACHAKYGSMPLHTRYCHEMGLRIVLAAIERQANVNKRYIVPQLSLSIDFYVRVFVRVYTSPGEVKKSMGKVAKVYHCIGCHSFHTQSVGRVSITPTAKGQREKYSPSLGPPVGQSCDQCGSRFQIGGPIWADPMHDRAVIGRMIEHVSANPHLFPTHERMLGLLTLAAEELPRQPLYYDLSQITRVVHCATPPLIEFRSALVAQGYQVSSAHPNPVSIKTNAPPSAVWDVMRCWAKKHSTNLSENSPGYRILQREPAVEACFDRLAAANPKSRVKGLKRFPENPEKNWGPKPRPGPAAGQKRKADESPLDPADVVAAKRAKNQGKNAHKKEKRPPVCAAFVKEGGCDKGDACPLHHPSTHKRKKRKQRIKEQQAREAAATGSGEDDGSGNGDGE